MSDPAQDLAALVADTLAAVESWKATGAFLAPTGPLVGLPAAEPWPAAPPGRPAARNEAPPRATWAPPAPRAPAPPPRAEPLARPPESPPRPVEPAPRPRPPDAEPRPLLGTPGQGAPAGGGLANLFGAKWQQALRDPVAEIAQLVAAAPPCPVCRSEGASLRGAGTADARLAVVAAGPGGKRLGGEAAVMFEKMLMHVLALERADVWIFEANECAVRGGTGSCRELLLRQLEVAAPRLVLAMGPAAAGILGVPPARGEWGRTRSSDVLPTFHPEELLLRPADKRAAMDHLMALRQRL